MGKAGQRLPILPCVSRLARQARGMRCKWHLMIEGWGSRFLQGRENSGQLGLSPESRHCHESCWQKGKAQLQRLPCLPLVPKGISLEDFYVAAHTAYGSTEAGKEAGRNNGSSILPERAYCGQKLDSACVLGEGHHKEGELWGKGNWEWIYENLMSWCRTVRDRT